MDVLGCVIEIASGMPFNQFLKTRIFDPLSMDDTAFMVGKDKVDRVFGQSMPPSSYNMETPQFPQSNMVRTP